jgi:3-methyladenine DNA glycosylase AlkD
VLGQRAHLHPDRATIGTNAAEASVTTSTEADTVEAEATEVGAIAGDLDRVLRAHADPDRADKERAYLKSELVHLGVSVPAIRSAARTVFREHRDELGHDELVGIVTALWDRPADAPVHERRMAAVELLELGRDELSVADAALLERLLRQCRTWALLDGLAVSVVGELADADPAGWDATVRRWAVDEDHWLRRAALLVHLPGLRRGAGDLERFGELADPMLEEREFFVRKAIGWVLREAGRRDPDGVVAWLEPRVLRAAGLTVREAVKYLPEPDRQRLLEARRA